MKSARIFGSCKRGCKIKHRVLLEMPETSDNQCKLCEIASMFDLFASNKPCKIIATARRTR